MKTIAFLNNKGGVLKTTLTTNIAGVLAKNDKKILILDTDPQSSVLTRFGRNGNDEKNNLSDLFRGNCNLKQAIKNIYENKIFAISSDFSLSMLQLELDDGTITSQGINKIFNNIKTKASQEFDYLLIDCSPSFGRITNEIIKLTDEIYVPMTMEEDSLTGLVNLLNVLKASSFENKLKWVIPTLFKSRTIWHNSVLEQWIKPLAKQEGFKVSANPIKDSIQESSGRMKNKLPIALTNSKSQAKTVYFKLAEEIGLI